MKCYRTFTNGNERNLPTYMKPKLDIANETSLKEVNSDEPGT